MILNKTDYNPFPKIVQLSKAIGGRENYRVSFYDAVIKELSLGGCLPQNKEEVEEVLVLLFNMDII